MRVSQSAENYLKAIYHLSEKTDKPISTNQIAKKMQTKAASVTDMVKKLSEKELIHYAKYKGVFLTNLGKATATDLIRKHRLWEVFLLEKLNFAWDEVHDLAEELEHIKSDKLTNKLDEFLGHPKFDPHGDPIPDAQGNIQTREQSILSNLKVGDKGHVVGVREHSKSFLQFLVQLNLNLGAHIEILEIYEYDQSLMVVINKSQKSIISNKVSQNLFITI